MAGAENKRRETCPIGDSSNIHSSCFTHIGHFVAVSVSNTSIPSAALRRMAWMDGRGKASCLKRPVGCELKAQCTECQQHLGQTVVHWMPTYISHCQLLQKGDWESKGRDRTIYLAIGFYFLQHFCKDFPFVNPGLHQKEYLISYSNREKSHTWAQNFWTPIICRFSLLWSANALLSIMWFWNNQVQIRNSITEVFLDKNRLFLEPNSLFPRLQAAGNRCSCCPSSFCMDSVFCTLDSFPRSPEESFTLQQCPKPPRHTDNG